MKNNLSINKYIVTLLCITTMTISFNIYLSFKDLYVPSTATNESKTYIADAGTPFKNSSILSNDSKNPLLEIKKINKSNPMSNLNSENPNNKIFIKIIVLFLSFIGLASIHNLIASTESDKKHNSRCLLNTAINKNTNIINQLLLQYLKRV